MASIGGLRDAHASVSGFASVTAFGKQLGVKLWTRFQAQHSDAVSKQKPSESWVNQTCSLLVPENAEPPSTAVDAIRHIIAIETKCTNVVPVHTDTCSTPIRAKLLQAWQESAGDPDTEVPQ